MTKFKYGDTVTVLSNIPWRGIIVESYDTAAGVVYGVVPDTGGTPRQIPEHKITRG